MDLAHTYFIPAFFGVTLALGILNWVAGRKVNALFWTVGTWLFLGIGEAVSILFTGDTISANTWNLTAESQALGGLQIALLVVLTTVLLTHLGKGYKRPPKE